MAPKTLYPLGEVFEQWDRPQVRTTAGRCDTIYNRPALDYDTYFKFQRLCRTRLEKELTTLTKTIYQVFHRNVLCDIVLYVRLSVCLSVCFHHNSRKIRRRIVRFCSYINT